MSHTLQIHSSAIPEFLGRPALEPVRLSGHEGMNRLFAYELLLKTPDALNLSASQAADWNLDSFIGREIACTIALGGAGAFLPGAVGAGIDRVGAGVRQINALITDASLGVANGMRTMFAACRPPLGDTAHD